MPTTPTPSGLCPADNYQPNQAKLFFGRLRTDSRKPEVQYDTQSGKAAAREGLPRGARRNEQAVADVHEAYEVERARRRNRCADVPQPDWLRPPYCGVDEDELT
jgi:hypothetical protein